MMLRWFGVGEGDEVILPAYVFRHRQRGGACAARPVFVDVNQHDFNATAEIEKSN